VTLLCFVLCVLSFFILSRVKEGKEKPIGFLVQRIMSPSVFRTFLTINVLGRGEESGKVARALRTVESASGAIAVSDIIKRLDDPDAEVREEAARALGRVGSVDAVEPLLRHLGDPHSTIRSHAARALGRIGDRRAIPSLIEGLDARSEELQEACCHALARLGATEAMGRLLRLFGEDQSDRVIGAAGEAMSRLGAMEAAIDILPRMHDTHNRVLRRQFAIALGNLLGTPGEFYRYVTGERASRSAGMERLAAEAQRNVQELLQGARLPGASEPSARSTVRDARHALSAALPRLRESVEVQDSGRVIEILWEILLQLCRLLYGKDIAEEEALGFALMHRPRLGLGLWFTSEVRSRLQSLHGSELLDTYAALGVYFLGSYRGETEGA
jgi:HEAT repeat protein